MVAIVASVLLAVILFFNGVAYARSLYYGAKLCQDSSTYTCYTVKRGDTWTKLFPDENERDIVMRLSRINTHLKRGMVLAIPKECCHDIIDYSPFAKQISAPGEKIIIVSLGQQAFGAYDSQGNLVRWGPVSGARGYCPDIHRGCHTPIGTFAIYNKEGEDCVSTKFPVPYGGAPMPYCMFFHGGFALHGSYEVPGYNASHGCVRMFVNDAQWLNEEFTADGYGTRVYVTQK